MESESLIVIILLGFLKAEKRKELKAWERMKYHYELIQDGFKVAVVESDSKKLAEKEISRYAYLYGQDGPVEIKEIKLRRSAQRRTAEITKRRTYDR